MNQSKRKHVLLIVLLLLIAVVSVGYMKDAGQKAKRTTITLVLPQNKKKKLSQIQDGMHDYASNANIRLDVWYKKKMSANELEELWKEEEKNGSKGIIFVYPEEYLERKKGGYNNKNVLAITDSMKEEFLYTASFQNVKEETYRLPVSETLRKQVKTGAKKEIYVENVYKLAYKSIRMMHTSDQLKSIALKPVRMDKAGIESGKYDALLAW